MSNNQLDTTTQDKKEQNLQLIANSLQAEMAKDFLNRLKIMIINLKRFLIVYMKLKSYYC